MTDYPAEILGEYEDDGTMPANVALLADNVVGHRIVRAEERDGLGYGYFGSDHGLVLTLDDGREVALRNTSDCCAFTELDAFVMNPELVDHVITGVGTTDGFSTWHIYADAGDIMKLTVGWSSGNPFYYGYGFEISVLPVEEEK